MYMYYLVTTEVDPLIFLSTFLGNSLTANLRISHFWLSTYFR